MITKQMVQDYVQFTIRLYRSMWKWLSKHPDKTVEDWPGCCILYTNKNEYEISGIIAGWYETYDPKKHSQLAYVIAHLPERGQRKMK